MHKIKKTLHNPEKFAIGAISEKQNNQRKQSVNFEDETRF